MSEKDPSDWTVVTGGSPSPFANQFVPPPAARPVTTVQQAPVATKHIIERIEFLLNEAMGSVNHGEDPSEYILQAIGYVHDLSSS